MVDENKKNMVFELYKSSRSVFRVADVALLLNIEKTDALRKTLNYYVQTRKLLNPRKGFYAKEGYRVEELACLLYPPTYISLEYVLQRAGVIFQYDSAITSVSYLSREVEVGNQTLRYRRIKGEILTNTAGVVLNKENINIATPERAFLDMLYLNKRFYFDNLHVLNKKVVAELLPVYGSETLERAVNKLFSR